MDPYQKVKKRHMALRGHQSLRPTCLEFRAGVFFSFFKKLTFGALGYRKIEIYWLQNRSESDVKLGNRTNVRPILRRNDVKLY